MTDTITLPRSVVEQALEAWEQARGALAYVAVGNAPSNPNLARSTCSQAVWVLDNAEPALRAALEQPQGEQEPIRWPANASEVRAFLSGHVAAERYARDDHQPDDSDTYTLSAHDLLGAIDWWTDFDSQPRQPLTEMEIVELRQLTPGTLDVQFVLFARAAAHAGLFEQDQARFWINASGTHVAYVDGPRNDERTANARLIAAAPELLVALQLYLAHASEPECAIWRHVQQKARAAIAKATGGAA